MIFYWSSGEPTLPRSGSVAQARLLNKSSFPYPRSSAFICGFQAFRYPTYSTPLSAATMSNSRSRRAIRMTDSAEATSTPAAAKA